MRLLEAHQMKFLLTPTLSRATLVWVLLGALTLVFPLLAKAQTNDQGAVVINGQISNQTCVLRVAESKDVNVSNDYILKLGTVPVATADSAAVGNTFGTAKTVYFYTAANATHGTCSQANPCPQLLWKHLNDRASSQCANRAEQGCLCNFLG
jgi:hypothetical protein